jgi:elongation factor Ts
MDISAKDVQNLRKMTDAGFMDCKRALEKCEGDIEKAVEILRKEGLAKADKKLHRNAGEGRIFSYIHSNQKIGVLVEIYSETDFVAKTPAFQELGKNIAMHIAAEAPLAIDRTGVPCEIIEKEKEIYKGQVEGMNKPAAVLDKIVEGKLDKFYTTKCLLEQEYIRDNTVTIDVLIKQFIGKVGENIVIGRFQRFQIGD